jgi:hypothetical protein
MSKILKLATVIFIGCLLSLMLYVKSNFQWRSYHIDSVELVLNEADKIGPSAMYLLNDNTIDFDFAKVYQSVLLNDTSIRFDIGETNLLRKLRFDFQKVGRDLFVTDIIFISKTRREHIPFDQFKLNGELNQVNNKEFLNKINIKAQNGSFEIAKHYVYPTDSIRIIVLFIVAIFSSLLFSYFLAKFLLTIDFSNHTYSAISVILFICSIFLPHPIFNLTLIISLLVVIKNFNGREFISNKLNLIFTVLFLLLLLNDVFISASGIQNLKATERNILFLILPIYVSCIKEVKVLKYFPISAIVIGVGLFLTSLVNAILFKNINYVSFEEFTKYIHPVYFSYLLSFSIFYTLLDFKIKTKHKNSIQAILFFFLILAGSKLIITLTLVFYAALFVRNKKTIFIVLFAAICLALFPPIQNRFKEIVNLNDLSVVQEKVITDTNDPRINGLTLRLLIWQETIKTVNTLPKFLVGIGLDAAADETLKVNLVKRGLEKYKRYSTHNQFINLYMRTGILGFSILLFLVGTVFYIAVIKKNKMLLIMLLMFIFAMLTESVLQRVLGMYFFTTVLLFLTKPKFLNENSDNWN